MIMDNFSLDVTGRDEAGLRLALELAFLGHSEHARAACWREDVHHGGTRLVFGTDYLLGKDGWHPLPTSVGPDAAADTAFAWLDQLDYPDQPDHDGSNVRGWRVVVGQWGHVQPYHYGAFASVMPAWAMCGK